MKRSSKQMGIWFCMALIMFLGIAVTASAENGDAQGSNQASSFPGSLYIIEEEAFEGTAFQTVYLSEGVVTIGERAFAENPSLIAVYIPDSAERIDQRAFFGTEQVLISGDVGSYTQSWARENGYRFGFLMKIMNQRERETEKGIFPKIQYRETQSEKQKTRCRPVQKAIRTGRTMGELKASHFKGIAAQHIQSRYFP